MTITGEAEDLLKKAELAGRPTVYMGQEYVKKQDAIFAMSKALAQRDDARARLDQAVEVLRPFAAEADVWRAEPNPACEILTVAHTDTCLHCGEKPYPARSELTVQDLRAAANFVKECGK